jgi:hypothetical protein
MVIYAGYMLYGTEHGRGTICGSVHDGRAKVQMTVQYMVEVQIIVMVTVLG